MELGFLGFGYSAGVLAGQMMAKGWQVWGTQRSVSSFEIPSVSYQAGEESLRLLPCAANTTHLLISIPPLDDAAGLTQALLPLLRAMPQLQWLGYFSTTGVYGDAHGAWVDETTPTHAQHARAAARIAEEKALLTSGLPVHIFRISGIYGMGRSVLDQLRAGTARRIDKEGQVFSRIHVEDIARVVQASMLQPCAGEVYNVADDLPCPAHEVVAHGAALMGMQPPPLERYEDIAQSLSPMMREFYGASRRVRNTKIKQELGVSLLYPTYREGLARLLQT